MIATFSDAVNSGADLAGLVQAALDDINGACRRHPDSPRDAGVLNPRRFVEHPLRLVRVDLIDRDSGEMVVDSPWGEKTATFSADDDISEFCGMDLMEIMR
jgi:hypothetical protein